ncbi:unnamed protein product, partial [Coregonus sp. 'balchen']
MKGKPEEIRRQEKKERKNHYEEALVKINATATDRLTVLKAKPQAIQRDMLLSYIEPEEFIQAFEKKDLLDNDKSCFSDHKKASSLEAYVEWFNRLSFLVATEICMVSTGMNMSPVSRLKKTWSKVKTAKFDVLEIVIPFFSLLIKDIYFLNEGCSNRMQNGHVNFEKFWEMAKQVSEFMVWKKVECPFEKDRKILQYLLTAPVFSEDALYLASYESEGPENHMEKDRWKSLSCHPPTPPPPSSPRQPKGGLNVYHPATHVLCRERLVRLVLTPVGGVEMGLGESTCLSVGAVTFPDSRCCFSPRTCHITPDWPCQHSVPLAQ